MLKADSSSGYIAVSNKERNTEFNKAEHLQKNCGLKENEPNIA